MKKTLLLFSLLVGTALSAAVTYTNAKYDASSCGFGEKSARILDGKSGSISFRFTGKFDRFGQEKNTLYTLFYSGKTQLYVFQMSKSCRLHFSTPGADGKIVSREKNVSITPGKPFDVKLTWGDKGTSVYFNNKLLYTLPVTEIAWRRNFAFGGMSKGLAYRPASGVFENIVISDGRAEAEKTAAAADGAMIETYKLDKLNVSGPRIAPKGIINPLAGEISFDFTGNFSRPHVGKRVNTYRLFMSGSTLIGVNQFVNGKLRLLFHFTDENGKVQGVEKVARIQAGKKFSVRVIWSNGEGAMYLDGKLFQKFKIKRFPYAEKFFFCGVSGGSADGVMENIVIKAAPFAAEEAAAVEKTAVSLSSVEFDFEKDDLRGWKLDAADGSQQKISIDTNNSFTGKSSLRVEKLNYLGDFEYNAPNSPRMAVKKGVTYELSARYRLESITDATVSCGFIFENAKGNPREFAKILGYGRRSLSNAHRLESMLPEKRWREFKTKFRAPADGFLRFTVTGGDGIFRCNIDTVSAKKLDPERANRIFFENFAKLNISSADALAGRDFVLKGAKISRVKKGLKIQFPGSFVWETEKLNPLVEYRMTIDSANITTDAKVVLVFRDHAEKELARYERPLMPPCFLDFEVPATACLATLAIEGKSGSAVIRSLAVDKNFTINKERALYNNEWQGYAIWDGNEKGKTAVRRTFSLDAKVEEAYIRFFGHNGAALLVNGREFGRGGQFAPGCVDVANELKAGKNVIALLVSCSSGGKKAMFEMYARDVNGKEYFITSDGSAKIFTGMPQGNWSDVNYDDSAWTFAQIRDGSARDFGNSGTAAIVNNRREDMYIGPRELFKLTGKKYSDQFPADGIMNINLTGCVPEEIHGGRVIFTQGKRVFRLQLADKEIKFDRKKLDIAFAPMFMPPGEYECALELFRTRFEDGVMLKLGKVTIGKKEKPYKRPVAKVKQHNGKAILHINGKPHPSGMFCTGRPYSPEVRQTNDWLGIKVHQIYINQRSTQPFISNAGLIDDRSGKYDLSVTEQILVDAAAQLRHDPDAYIIPLICNGVPADFSTRSDRQDDLLVTGKGYKLWLQGPKRIGKFGQPYKNMSEIPANSQVAVSHASKNKMKVYTDMVRATVEYFENSPLAEKIIGYGVSGEMDNQLYPYMPYGGYANQLGRGDYSPVMLAYFREFLKKKYGTDFALQQAWQDDKVTLATAQIPSDAEREGNNFFVSPAVADYVAAFGLSVLDLTSAMTRTIKEATGGRCLTWLYPSDNAGLDGVMHYAYHSLCYSSGYNQYTEKSVDMFGNPGNYTMRRNGLSSGQYGAPASARMNNKIWSPEMDLRSFVIGAYSTSWGPDSLFASQSHWAKEMMTTLQHGAGYRIYTFWPGWLNNAGVMDEVALLQNISKRQLDMPRRWKPEVCLLHDSYGLEYTGDFTNRRMHFFLRAVGGFNAAELLTAGAGMDFYYMQDILRDDFPADQYKVYLISQAYKVDEKMLNAIQTKLQGKGKVIIWRWGAAYLDKNNRPDPATVEKVTGFKVKPYKVGSALPPAVVNKEIQPWTKGMLNTTVAARFRYNTSSSIPYFTLNDPQAAVLADFTTGESVLGVKKINGGTSIYAALPAIPARMLRNIYAAAGVHTYVDTEYDFVCTDGNFISLHSGVGGKKCIRLPETVAQVINVHTGKVVAENTDKIEFNLRANGTAIFEVKR